MLYIYIYICTHTRAYIKYPRIVVVRIGWKKSNNGIKQDFGGTDYEVDIVIKIKKIPHDCFIFIFSLLTFLCSCIRQDVWRNNVIF